MKDPNQFNGFKKLTPREEVIHAMLTGEPYQEYDLQFVAQAFGVSRQRISQIERCALNKIKNLLSDPRTALEIVIHLK